MNHYAPEHHPNCPRFESFERGEIEDTAPPCQCEECQECGGSGEVDSYEDVVECDECDGLGRVMTLAF